MNSETTKTTSANVDSGRANAPTGADLFRFVDDLTGETGKGTAENGREYRLIQDIDPDHLDAFARADDLPVIDCGELWKKPWIAEETSDPNIGYVPLDGKLVPISFLDYLNANCRQKMVAYGTIVDPRSMFSDKVWGKLDDDERKIVPACILHMMACTAIRVISFGPEDHSD